MPRTRRVSDDEILDAALPVMVRKGPRDFTLGDIAAAIGMAPATLLQRFSTKQKLIERVFARDNERFAEWMKGLPPGRGVKSILALYESAIETFGADENLADHLLWLREDFRNPQLNKITRQRFRLWYKALEERLPPMRVPPKVAARLLDAQLQGALNQWGIFREGRLADYVMSSLRNWLRLSADK